MAPISRLSVEKVVSLFGKDGGVNAEIAGLTAGMSDDSTMADVVESEIITQNVPLELIEKSAARRYPIVQVYCEKLRNQQTEKFRRFSGVAQMAVEVRCSQDRLEGIEQKTQVYVEAVARVLEASRGEWGSGMFYGGGYDAVFGGVKHGGKNFVQTAKITFEVGVSTN